MLLGAPDTSRISLTTVDNNTVIIFDTVAAIIPAITLEGVTGFADLQAAVDAGWLVIA
ncbi:hypothetical protein JMJ56_31550 [Belnapia sp. T18]|uniref:Uncharacterized protein n=1 Tax=Belnapia arida TaxID=2804533 RepID=A0ABS1UCT7_9PROT|nr:hypothetical protein [Belnapia arida]MBL6082503.1 hypothetical protein [Belnapia arida]